MEPPFNKIIVGMTGAGKTTYLLNLLDTEYKDSFGRIFIICPTYSSNDAYKKWSNKLVKPIECEHTQINNELSDIIDQVRTDEKSTLIVLDDCTSSKCLKDRSGPLVTLGFHGRHFNISTIVLTQQLTSVVKPFRDNVSKIVTFYNPSRIDMKVIFDNYLDGVSRDEFDDIKRRLRNERFRRLEITLVYPYDFSVN